MRDESLTEFCWSPTTGHDPVWQEWSHHYSVFNPETGETHLISELPAALLRLLTTTASPSYRLAAHLAETCGVAMTPDWEQKVASVLTNLEHLELVELVERLHAEEH